MPPKGKKQIHYPPPVNNWKTTIYKSLFILLALNLIPMLGKAQEGTACENAISGKQECSNTIYTMSGAEFWYSFKAESEAIKVELANTQNGHLFPNVENLFIYKSDRLCEGLKELSSVVSINKDTLKILRAENLEINNIYYLKLVQFPDERGEYPFAEFKLCIEELNKGSYPPIFNCSAPVCENLVINGDFEDASSDTITTYPHCNSLPSFQSDYCFSNHKNPGNLIIATNAYNYHTMSWNGLGYGGSGKFLMADISSTTIGDNRIWSQKITNIIPGKSYYFSFQVNNLCYDKNFDEPRFRVKMDGLTQNLSYIYNYNPVTSTIISVPEVPNRWIQICGTWTASQNNTIFSICGVSRDSYGNDIGIDHIEFREIFMINAGADQTICPGTSVTLSATGASSYTWSTGETTPSITVTPTQTTTYTVAAFNGTCTATDEVVVNVLPAIAWFDVVGNTNQCADYTNFSIENYNNIYNYTFSLDGVGNYPINGPNFQIIFATYGYPANYNQIIKLKVKASNGLCQSEVIKDIYPCCKKTDDNGLPIVSWDNATYNQPNTLPSPINDKLIINGTLTLNNNMNLHNKDIFMGPDAKIICNPNGSLKLYGCNLQSCGTYMWDGIYLDEPTEEVFIQAQSTSTTAWDKFKDSKNGIVASNNAKVSIVPYNSQANSAGMQFINNYQNISLKYYSDPAKVKISKVNFIGGNLLYPHLGERTKYGIYANMVYDIVIGDPSSYYNKNYFTNMDCAIDAYFSTIKVYNNKFENIQSKTTSAIPFQPNDAFAIRSAAGPREYGGITVGGTNTGKPANYQTNEFKNCEAAVYLFGNQTTNIKGNTFTNTSVLNNYSPAIYQGGFTSHFNPINIENNTIEGFRTGISLSGQNSTNTSSINMVNNEIKIATPAVNDYSFGIKTVSSSGIIIEDNAVSSSTASIWQIFGIALYSSPGANIRCNEISNTGHALSFYLNNPCSIKQNTFENAVVGFCLGGYKDLNTGQIYSGYVGQQGMPGNPNDNKWTGSFTYLTKSYFSDGRESKFYVRNTQSNFYNPGAYPAQNYPNPDNGDEFFIRFITTTGVCSEPACGGTTPNTALLSPAQLSQMIIDTASNTSDDIKWQNKRQAYKHINKNKDLLTNDDLQQFYEENLNSNIGKLDSVENLIAKAQLTEATLLQAEIVPSLIFDQHEKALNDVILRAAKTDDVFAIETSDIVYLQQLAASCPYVAGNSVYTARAILYQTGDKQLYQNACEVINYNEPITASRLIHVGNENNATKVGMENKEDAQLQSEIFFSELVPNPASDKVSLYYQINADDQYIIHLTDIMGKTLFADKLKSNNQSIEININALKEGVYFYTILSNKTSIKQGKLIIVK